MSMLTDDMIDFAKYMADTDAAHKVRSAGQYADEVVDFFHNPAPHLGAKLPWEKTHGLIRFRDGEVTLWAGMNGHGKSLLLGQASLGWVLQQDPVCVASMEMKPRTTLARVCRQGLNTNRPERDDIVAFLDIIKDHLWLYDQQGTVRHDKMLAVCRYCAEERKIRHMVIDSLMKCGIGEDDYNAQKRFVDELCAVARDTGMHVHLVAHSRKARDEMSAPGKMDVKGSGAIIDQADNIINVWRNKAKESPKYDGPPDDPDCVVSVDKQRNGEWEGLINLWFDRASMTYHESRYY